MWEDVCLEEDQILPWIRERAQSYDGTVFLCCAAEDLERREALREALGAEDSGGLLGTDPATLAGVRRCLFVSPRTRGWEPWIRGYLAAWPPEVRHVLFYFRRRGNGPSAAMSLFMDFWRERGVDIWDFGKC